MEEVFYQLDIKYILGNFRGDFNGNNNTIYNIYVDIIVPTNGGAGLFGVATGGKISNLTITGTIKGREGGNLGGTGGILGKAMDNCVISNCYNLCDIHGEGHTGGIVGGSNNSKIINCYNMGEIKIEGNIVDYASSGGIVGSIAYSTNNNYSSIINCYNLNSVENYSTRGYAGAGGITGSTSNNSECTIVNCYNIGKTMGKNRQGSIVGGYWYDSWISNLDKCYYLEGTCDKPVGHPRQNVTEGTILCTNEYMKSQEFVDELNSNIENGFQYEEENEEGETETITIDTTGCAKWVYNENSYPTLDLGTIWNGTTWE